MATSTGRADLSTKEAGGFHRDGMVGVGSIRHMTTIAVRKALTVGYGRPAVFPPRRPMPIRRNVGRRSSEALLTDRTLSRDWENPPPLCRLRPADLVGLHSSAACLFRAPGTREITGLCGRAEPDTEGEGVEPHPAITVAAPTSSSPDQPQGAPCR